MSYASTTREAGMMLAWEIRAICGSGAVVAACQRLFRTANPHLLKPRSNRLLSGRASTSYPHVIFEEPVALRNREPASLERHSVSRALGVTTGFCDPFAWLWRLLRAKNTPQTTKMVSGAALERHSLRSITMVQTKRPPRWPTLAVSPLYKTQLAQVMMNYPQHTINPLRRNTISRLCGLPFK